MQLRQLLLLLVACCTSAYAAILGLDIGHDFTKAALVAPGVPFEIVMSADSKRKDQSALAFKPLEGGYSERVYGSQTSSLCTRFPQRCIQGVKNLLGQSIEDNSIQHYLQQHPGLQLKESKNQRNTVSVEIDGHAYPVEELLAMSVENILTRASLLLKEKSPGGYSHIQDVAVTVPSFFTMAQRNAIKDAIELAGLNLVALVDDGLAIAVNYATSGRDFPVGQTEHHIIYDMGAGSTKATLVSFSKQNESTPVSVEVEAYDFDSTLGGAYFTNAVAELAKAKFLEQHSIHSTDFQNNARAMAKLYQAAEKAKLVLSANNDVQVSIESLYDDIDCRVKISREEFEDYIADASTRVTAPIDSVLQKSGLALDQLTSVIYAGGSTRVPFVQRQLLNLIGEDLVSKTINADEAAVFGAALRGIQISKMFRSKELNVTEPSPLGYMITVGEETLDVFPVGTPLGQSTSIDLTEYVQDETLSIDVIEDAKRYVTYDAGKLETIQSNFKFNVSECEEGVKYIGKFSLTQSRLFSVDALEAQCQRAKPGFFDKLKGNSTEESGKPQIKKSLIPAKPKYLGPRPLGNASKQELKQHLATMRYADQQKKLVSEKLNELEASLYSARSFLSDDDIVEKVPEERLEEANSLVSEYLEWLDYESDGATIKEIRSKLEDVQKKVNDVKEYLEQLSTPLGVEEFERVHQLGVTAVTRFQEIFMNSTEETMRIAVELSEAGLDFEEEFKKAVKGGITEEEFEEAKKNVTTTFATIKELCEDAAALEALGREGKFDLRREALQRIEELKKVEIKFKASHAQRMKALKFALNKALRAQRKAAAKEEEAKLKESVSESSGETASTEEEGSTTTDFGHDEL